MAQLCNIRGLVWLFSVLLHVCRPVPNPLPSLLMDISHINHLNPCNFFLPFMLPITNSLQPCVRFTLLSIERWFAVCSSQSICIWTGGRLTYPREWVSKMHFGLEASLNTNYIVDHLAVKTALGNWLEWGRGAQARFFEMTLRRSIRNKQKSCI